MINQIRGPHHSSRAKASSPAEPASEPRKPSAVGAPIGAPPTPEFKKPGAERTAGDSSISGVEARRRANNRGRDEALDDNGKVRPHYRSVWPLVRAISQRRMARALRESRAAFRGDNALHPVPRLLTETEYATLKKGVEQRGKALAMFLADHYSGRRTYSAIIPTGTVDRIIERNNEWGYQGLLKPEQISFPYGPDIMRANDGNFYVIEDNTGFIGGPGDLLKAREILFKLQPGYEKLIAPLDDPKMFYIRLVAMARARAVPHDGKLIMYSVPPYPDNEDGRLRKIMEDVGVEWITPHTQHKLVTNQKGVFIRNGNKLERVGFVFINGEHKWVDASHPSTRGAYVLGVARETLEDDDAKKTVKKAIEAVMVPDPKTGHIDVRQVEKVLREHELISDKMIKDASPARGLVEAMFAGKVAANYAPGIDFIGDKAFKGYVDDLVRFYLKEEPALPSIPVHRFTKKLRNGRVGLSEAMIHRLFDDQAYKNFVFKVVDGRGGTGVYIGPKMKKAEVKPLIEKIRHSPEAYVAEPFKKLSTLTGHIVDLRLISSVDPDRVVVTPTPWGRGVPMDGDGKVNLSQKGKEFAVLVVREGERADPPKPDRAPSRPYGISPRKPKLRVRKE